MSKDVANFEDLAACAKLLDAQPVPTEGRVFWDGERWHGVPPEYQHEYEGAQA